MTEFAPLIVNFRLQIGSKYMKFVGVYHGTTVPINVNIHRRSGQSAFSFGSGGTDTATLYVTKEDFGELKKCQIPTPLNEPHQIEFDEDSPLGENLYPVRRYHHCNQTIVL
jgi:hypothetical protein